MIINYSLMLLAVVILFMLSLLNEWSWALEFDLVWSGTFKMSLSLILEKHSAAFALTVLLIFTMVYLYSFSYLSSEIYIKRFLAILSVFVLSMMILILSGNLFSSLIGWDGLGVTSMFLILFYYSKSAFKASLLTFLMNRVGDCFFILSLAQVLLMSSDQACYPCTSYPGSVILLLILTSITKSAQIPFSTWLPAAMEAPTPVSAMVHSSTLVTAGIYLLYRYKELWVQDDLKCLLMVLSVGTCFMAALSALVENDLKKLIALSTLSQLGFIMFSFSLGLLEQGYIHMLMHAYFKALLFMCAGLIIHSSSGSQSITSMTLSGSQNPLLMSVMSCSLMSMMGLPFLSGFYSKDSIIDSLKEAQWSVLIMVMLVLSFICTCLYSVRVVWYLLNSGRNWHSMTGVDLGMAVPMIPLAALSSVGGSCVSWLLVEDSLYVNSSKMPILLILGTAVSIYWYAGMVKASPFLESKWGLSTFNPMMASTLFKGASLYKYSSDLLGIPELVNKGIKTFLSEGSSALAKTMLRYSGNAEVLAFLVLIMVLTL